MEANFVKYYTELVRFRSERKERRELSDYEALLRSLQSCQTDSVGCGEVCQARTRLENMVLADWLLSIDQRLLLYILRTNQLEKSSLSEIEPKLIHQIRPCLKLIRDLSFQDILTFTAQSCQPGAVEMLPPSTWRRVFSFLAVSDLKSVVLVSRYWRAAGEDPDLAWRRMTVRSRTVLMFGLQHFLSARTFANIETLDFSSVQLETFELSQLCEFCCRNTGLNSLNLSDKIFVELDPSLLCSALSTVSTLRLRYSTVTLDQLNQLLDKICRVKKVKVLDILGLKISDKDPAVTVSGKFLNITECSGIYFHHVYPEQSDSLNKDIFHFLRQPAEGRLAELSVGYEELESLPPTFSARHTFHCLDLTWAQWTSVLTHNILANNIKKIHIVRHPGTGTETTRGPVEDMKIPYQIFGESLATATVLTLRGYRVSSQQASTLFNHLRTSLCLKDLELDEHVTLSSIPEQVFTEVLTSLEKIKLVKTNISNKQLTAFLTHVLNQGTNVRELRLLGVSLPRVHPNILGPGLAQFPALDISGSVMTDQQQGTVFFSILDTRKVRRLSLESCDLRPVNFVILATSVSCVERANLSRSKLQPEQLVEILKRCLQSKTLKFLQIDKIPVPESIIGNERDNLIGEAKTRFNISTKENRGGMTF